MSDFENIDEIEFPATLSDDQKLDAILKYLSLFYFKNDADRAYDCGFVLYSEFKKHTMTFGVYNSECLSIALYLSRHNYIDLSPIEGAFIDSTPAKVRIQFSGMKFMNEGGFSQKTRDSNSRREIEKNLLLISKRNEKTLSVSTLVLALATSFLLIVEIIKFVFEHQSFFCGH